MTPAHEALVRRALMKSRDGATFEDVVAEISSGRAQLWFGAASVAVTQIDGADLHVWLAAGVRAELLAMADAAASWANGHGFSRLTVSGARNGWSRVLLAHGWRQADETFERAV